jgi:hypothetical protein
MSLPLLGTGTGSTAGGGVGPATVRSGSMLLGGIAIVVNTSATPRDANAAGIMINSR